MQILLAIPGLVAGSVLPCRAETGVALAYLRGQHRVVFRVTARDSDTPPALPDHCTLTYAQRVLAQGSSPDGAYIDIEVRTVLPASIDTRAPYPVERGELPDSLTRYLKGTGSGSERAALDRLLDGINESSPPTYQDEVVGGILGWVANNVEYDSTTLAGQDPLAVMERRTATCAGFAELSVALLRRAGIPARRMGCVVPPDCGWGQLGRGGRHAFIEVYYPDVGWLPSDPLRSFHFVDPFHLLTRIDGRGTSRSGETLDFRLLEDDSSMELAVLFAEPGLLRWSAVVRRTAPDTCTWAPYTFLHRRLDGSFVFVGAQGDQVISSRDGRREFRRVWGDREIFDAENNCRLVEAETPWYPRRVVQREGRGGQFRFFPDGRREFAFKSGALEIRYPDGRRTFRAASPEGFEKTTEPDGRQEIRYPDGTRVVRAADGREEVDFPNGDRRLTGADGVEIYLFAGGEKQITYRDGTQEVEWASGARQVRSPGGDLRVERGAQ